MFSFRRQRDPYPKQDTKPAIAAETFTNGSLGSVKQGRPFFLEAVGTLQLCGKDGKTAAWLWGRVKSWEHWEKLVLTWMVQGRHLRWHLLCLLVPAFAFWHPWHPMLRMPMHAAVGAWILELALDVSTTLPYLMSDVTRPWPACSPKHLVLIWFLSCKCRLLFTSFT